MQNDGSSADLTLTTRSIPIGSKLVIKPPGANLLSELIGLWGKVGVRLLSKHTVTRGQMLF